MNRKIFMTYLPKECNTRMFTSYKMRLHQNSYGYELNLYSTLRNTGFIDRNVETFRYERDNKQALTEYVPCTLTLDKFSITYRGYPHEFGIYCTDGLFCNQAIAFNCISMSDTTDDVSYFPCEETIHFLRTDNPSFTSRALPGCDIFIPSQPDASLITVPENEFTRTTLVNIRNAGEFIHHKLFGYTKNSGIDMYFGKVSFNHLSGDLYVDMLSERNGVRNVVTGKIEALCDLTFSIDRYTNE